MKYYKEVLYFKEVFKKKFYNIYKRLFGEMFIKRGIEFF